MEQQRTPQQMLQQKRLRRNNREQIKIERYIATTFAVTIFYVIFTINMIKDHINDNSRIEGMTGTMIIFGIIFKVFLMPLIKIIVNIYSYVFPIIV